ncbi:hypothetical protein NpPPO83_00012259 [Neofusicoccum parvum]|uniref:Uncharacterized protein n=1 Tax=Neofusicoccum parvum TaxID=310453 RepID=A0ACB5RN85_9PEZI|nr:hypothetical protein NpPPO83_00012259 [Neofusicoccum parvum]
MCILFSHNRRALTHRRHTPNMPHHGAPPWHRMCPPSNYDSDDASDNDSASDPDLDPGFPPTLDHECGCYYHHRRHCHQPPPFPPFVGPGYDPLGPAGPPPVAQMVYGPMPPPPPPPPELFYGGYGPPPPPPGWGPYGYMRGGGGGDDEKGGFGSEGVEGGSAGASGDERRRGRGGRKARPAVRVGDLPALVEEGGMKGAVEWEEWAVGGTGRNAGDGGGEGLPRVYGPRRGW